MSSEKLERMIQLRLGRGLEVLRKEIAALPTVKTETALGMLDFLEVSEELMEKSADLLLKQTEKILRLEKLMENAVNALEECNLPRPENYWDHDDTYPVKDWQYEVANDDTRLGYWPWVANQREMKDEDDTP